MTCFAIPGRREPIAWRGFALRACREVALLVLACCSLGCSVYEATLLEPPDVCDDPESSAAAACGTHDSSAPATDPQCGDGGCAICGNGTLDPGESCDPPESCPLPDSCRAVDVCTVAVFSGEPGVCTAVCDILAVTRCISGDDCCPSGCSQLDDDDCLGRCGDGVVDRDRGETCERGVAGSVCPTRCDDDDVCTMDSLEGSAAECDARCNHRPITVARDGDGCCPAAVDAAADDDCAALCQADPPPGASDLANACVDGNTTPPPTPDPPDDDGMSAPQDADGSARPVEDADSEDDGDDDGAPQSGAGTDQPVDPDQDQLPAEQAQCRALLTSSAEPASDACSACVCERCQDEVFGCYASEDESRDARCTAIMDCKQRVACVGEDCYCGASRGCLFPTGPCATEIIAASAGARSLADCVADPSCANFRSTIMTECLERSCTSECRR
jgi:hypothetical protein